MSSNSTMLKWIYIMAILVQSALSLHTPTEADSLFALRQSLNDPDNKLESWDPTMFDACVFFYVTCEDGQHVSRIDLVRLNLSGKLVPDLANLAQLQYLNINENNIQGSIPPELGNLQNLIGLFMVKNQISGPIPKELGKLKSLMFMQLNDNRLSGPIPTELANLSGLRVLQLNDNRLTGPIPTELTTLNNLQALNFSNNDLCGTIPRTGAFANIPMESFKNNPRLHGPQWLGLAANGGDC